MKGKEMLRMLLNGATYQEIADHFNISKQAVNDFIVRYAKNIANNKRGCDFSCDEIVYEGIFEYFIENENENVTTFAAKILGGDRTHSTKIREFITGKKEPCFSIAQIKRICEIVGKPFEETFKEREG